MSVELKHHIELRGDNPLTAVIAGTTRTKAYLVANLAILDGVDVAVEQFGITQADVHAAIAFYYDNEAAIKQAGEEAITNLRKMGARDAGDVRKEIERRQR